MFTNETFLLAPFKILFYSIIKEIHKVSNIKKINTWKWGSGLIEIDVLVKTDGPNMKSYNNVDIIVWLQVLKRFHFKKKLSC